MKMGRCILFGGVAERTGRNLIVLGVVRLGIAVRVVAVVVGSEEPELDQSQS